MAAYEILLLNTAIPQIQAAQSGDTYLVPRDIAFSAALTLSAGTANGVPYLSSPGKVLTTGSALTFDGTNLSAGSSSQNLGTSSARWGTVYATAFSDGTDQLVGSSGTAVRIGYGASWAAQSFAIGGSEQMRLTSTGLGIGTNNPTAKLDVVGNATVSNGDITVGTAGKFLYSNYVAQNSGNSLYLRGATASGQIEFQTNTTTKATLDSSGNLGLGVTPSAWGGSFKAFQIVSGGTSLWSDGSVAFYNRNTFYDGTNRKYVVSGYAQEYAQLNDGSHAWKITSSGNANDPITFTQAMTLDASGNLKLGGTANRATTAGTNHLDIFNGTAPVGTLADGISIYSAAGEAYVMDAAGNATLFSPHDAETNEWIFKSKHTPTGKVLKIDVERLLKFVNDHFGLDAVHEFVEE